MKLKIVSYASPILSSAAGANAFAQSSVTLYGIVDTGFSYQSSQTSVGSTTGGRSAIKVSNGTWAGSRFGLKGSEDLGGGTKAIFQLEEGFNSATGAQAVSGLAFNRQAWVGVSNTTYGSLTAGRPTGSDQTSLAGLCPAHSVHRYALLWHAISLHG